MSRNRMEALQIVSRNQVSVVEAMLDTIDELRAKNVALERTMRDNFCLGCQRHEGELVSLQRRIDELEAGRR